MTSWLTRQWLHHRLAQHANGKEKDPPHCRSFVTIRQTATHCTLTPLVPCARQGFDFGPCHESRPSRDCRVLRRVRFQNT
jgi:hypothetical protein